MKRWWSAASLAGVCCSSLCFLGLPLLAMWASALGLGWLSSDGVMRAMLLMFLAMFGVGMVGAYRVHRRRGPAVAAVMGFLLLAGTAWHKLPHAFGWLALGLLVFAWLWDWRLVKRGQHHEPMECHT